MDLEQLGNRLKEIDTAIVNMTGQLNSLHGHKAETQHWIQQIENVQNNKPSETEPCVEPTCSM